MKKPSRSSTSVHTPSRRNTRRQRGGVAVETALCIPLLVLVIVGGVHFGMVLMTRHKLTEATNYATRSAVVKKTTNANQIRSLIVGKMGTGNSCTSITVNSSSATDALGVRRLDVSARCVLDTGIGGALLGAVGPADISVAVSMPL